LEVITYHTLFVVVESRYENDFLRRHRIAAFLISRFRLFSLLKPKKTIGSTGKVKYRSSLYREHRKSEIPQLCLFVLVKAMWRRSSLSLSQTLTFSSSKLLQFQSYGAVRPLYSSSSSPSSSSSAPNSFDLGFPKPDGTPAFSATALDLSSLASASASTARHYARCYWELSKARLSMLVVATSGTGFVLASGTAVDFAGKRLKSVASAETQPCLGLVYFLTDGSASILPLG
jgi:hypothetical protein